MCLLLVKNDTTFTAETAERKPQRILGDLGVLGGKTFFTL
jgi:hypothetical protein